MGLYFDGHPADDYDTLYDEKTDTITLRLKPSVVNTQNSIEKTKTVSNDGRNKSIKEIDSEQLTKEKSPTVSIMSHAIIDDKSIIKLYLNYRNPTTKRFIDKLNEAALNKLALGLTKIHQAIPAKYREWFYMNEIDSSKPATIDEFTIKGQYILHCKFNKDTMRYDCTLCKV